MKTNHVISLSVALIVALLGNNGFAGENAAVEAALKKTTQIAITDKTFEEAVKELCRAAGIEPAAIAKGKKPREGAKMGGRFSAIVGMDSGQIEEKIVNGVYLYSIKPAKPLAIGVLLKKLCEQEGLVVNIADGKLAVVTTAELPFVPAELKARRNREQSNENIPMEKDWRKAVRFLVVEIPKIEKKQAAGPALSIADKNSIDYIFETAVGALKGRPEKDAVRAWLLSKAAEGLWCKEISRRDARGPHGQIVAAVLEAKTIYDGPGRKQNVAELTKTLMDAYKELAQWLANNSDEPFWLPTGEHAFAQDYANGLYYAGTAWLAMGETEKGLPLLHEAALVRLGAPSWAGHFFDTYYQNIADAEARIKAAEEDLKRIETAINDWRCPSKGVGVEAYGINKNYCIAKAHFRLARILHDEKIYERAVAEYTEALRLDSYDGGWSEKEIVRPSGIGGRRDVGQKGEYPQAARTRIFLADALVAWGKRDEALTMLKEARAAQPAESSLALKLGSVLEGAGQKDEARKIYNELLELYPDNRTAKTRLALLDGKDPRAVFADPNVEENKDAFKALNQEIRDLRDQLKYPEALEKIREGLKTFPNNPSLLLQEWTLLCNLDKENEPATKAIEEKLIKLGYGPRLQRRPMVLVDKDGKPTGRVRTPEERAEGTAKAAVRQEIIKLRAEGKNEEALVKIRDAQRQYPDDTGFLSDEYFTLQRMGRTEEAKQIMAKMTARRGGREQGKEAGKEARPPREKGRRLADENLPPIFRAPDDDEF